MIYIGIDPGTPLTIAAVTSGGDLLDIWDKSAVATQETRGKSEKWYNNPSLIAAVLRPYAALDCLVVLEHVSPMPAQGIVSSCRFVGSMYLAHGVAAGLGMRVVLRTPSVWKKAMGLSPDKERSRAKALEMWPGSSDRFKRKMDHDRAEAALLALYERDRNQPSAA